MGYLPWTNPNDAEREEMAIITMSTWSDGVPPTFPSGQSRNTGKPPQSGQHTEKELLVKDILPDLEKAEDVAERIKTVRTQSQADVTRQFYAHRLGFTVGTVSSWANTNPFENSTMTNTTNGFWPPDQLLQQQMNSDVMRQQLAQQQFQQRQNQQQAFSGLAQFGRLFGFNS